MKVSRQGLLYSDCEVGIEQGPITNLCLRSYDLSHEPTWVRTNVLVESAQGVIYDGTNNHWNFISGIASGERCIVQSVPVVAAQTYVFSFYVKPDDIRSVEISINDAVTRCFYQLNMDSGEGGIVGEVYSADHVSMGDGSYRIWIAKTMVETGLAALKIKLLGAYTLGHGLYATWAQFETGAIPTKYIPTVNTSESSDPYVPEWSEFTTYPADMEVWQGIKTYISVGDGNQGNRPNETSTGEDPKWLESGWVNRYKMFDPYLNTATESPDTYNDYDSGVVSFIFQKEGISSISFFELEATSIKVDFLGTGSLEPLEGPDLEDILGPDYMTITYPVGDSGFIWTETKDLYTQIDQSTSWWEYFFGDFAEPIKNATFDFPYPTYEEKVRVTIYNQGGPAKCGMVIAGRSRSLGVTLWDVETGILDFSKQERDEDFGHVFLSPGNTAGAIDAMLYVETSRVDSVYSILKGSVGQICAYDFNENSTAFSSLIVAGFFEDFRIIMKSNNFSYINISIRGVV